MSWLLDLLLSALSPMDWFRGPKRGQPRTVVHVDAAGRVVSRHERGDDCASCRPPGVDG